MISPPPCSTVFPYTTLFRSRSADMGVVVGRKGLEEFRRRYVSFPAHGETRRGRECLGDRRRRKRRQRQSGFHRDRKSTRLNSSHANISYAVFCLKKKT